MQPSPRREIGAINFGILSADEILKMSVCELGSSALSGNGSVYDPRMGFSSDVRDKVCITCNLDYEGCPGHYGHIQLPLPIVHPNLKFFKMVSSFVRCICYKCNKLLVTRDQLILNNIFKYRRNNRFNRILDKLKKDNTCPECNTPQPKIVQDLKERTLKFVCKNDSRLIEIPLSTNEIFKMFDNLTNDDVSLLGFDPALIHPRNLIISVLPVIPPCSRPTVVTDSAICDDDLTTKYIEIIKHVKKFVEKPNDDMEQMRILKSIEFHVSTLFDNSKGLSKHSTNLKPTSSFRERITGKNALVRSNLMGKRCNQTARTVIGPDPTLRLGQLAVPVEIARNLTVPEVVTSFNKQYLEDLVRSKKANYVIRKDTGKRINLEYALTKHGTRLIYGDVVIRNGNELKYLEQPLMLLKPGDKIRRGCNSELITATFDEDKPFNLQIGDTVERQLRDGDLVLLNRQPTLHRGSMMAKEIVIKPYKTLRFNLASTKSFNADFDGDEMNIHAGQTLEGRAELLTLSATKHNLMTAQSSKPNIVIVQDALLGVYNMTKSNVVITKSTFFGIVNNAIQVDGSGFPCNEILDRMRHIRSILELKGCKNPGELNGKSVFSFTLPLDFNYENKNDADPTEHTVRIYKGVLYEGVINKADVGGASNSIIQCLYKEYGKDITATFIDNVQFLVSKWLDIAGFTVGLKDCVASKGDEIDAVVERCFVEANTVNETTFHPGVREARINATLGKARDIGLKMAKDAMNKNNNFLATVMAGSKGDFFNIAQITGLLGQQTIDGQRLPKHLSNGTRSLPHYPFGKLDTDSEYESRGFIRNSFIHGLNPKEFYLHAMTGRDGIINTSVSTARSGYIQRRIVKIAEDISVKYDGTIRNLDNNIYEFAYADCGLDPAELIVKGGKSMICNLSRMVDRLNMKCE